MQAIGSYRSVFSFTHRSLTRAALLLGTMVLGSNANAQEPSNPPGSPTPAEAPVMTATLLIVDSLNWLEISAARKVFPHNISAVAIFQKGGRWIWRRSRAQLRRRRA